ncbi:MAG TPA: OmpH family outer membrane protein [Salinimicrobium sp.]|nr:OmpH family outer membrane protein [Salinimicrobium sp.]
MKKTILFTSAAMLLVFFSTRAQGRIRIGYVDMEYILQNVPEYQQATAQLERKVQQWKAEIEVEMNKIEALKTSLENEKALLTNELIQERKEEIRYQEQKLLEYQQKRFGPNGDLMTQKLLLVQPIQDQVFAAIQEIGKNRDYDLILNKSSDIAMLYVAERLDVSDQVLRSINRASNRTEVNSEEERKEILQEEEKTVEESKAVSKREALQAEREKERAELLEERQKRRDSVVAAKKAAYEARRAKVMEERQRKKDSVAEARKNNNEVKQE